MVAPPAVVVTTATAAAVRRVRTPARAPARKALDQPFQRIDAGDPAFGEEHPGDIVLARERAGVRHRKFARRGRAAELVGHHRLAALGRFEREGAQRVALRMVSRNST